MTAKEFKQVCQKPGPSVVLIGNSAASSGLLKFCGSDMGPGKTRRAAVMKQRRNRGTDVQMDTSSNGRQQIKLNGSDTQARLISIHPGGCWPSMLNGIENQESEA
jgi:hypothetical protein